VIGREIFDVESGMEQKLTIAKILDNAGVYQIEAGTPAVGSYEMETIYRIMQRRKKAKISVWNRLKLQDIQRSIETMADIIHIGVPVSYVQIYNKLKKNKTWLLGNMSACVEYAQSHGKEVTVGFEDASRADITFMVALAEMLVSMKVDRVRFADTVGVLTPARCAQAVKELVSHTGSGVEIHAHNDLGMAVANSVAGAGAGADYIDTTILGIGNGRKLRFRPVRPYGKGCVRPSHL
jgi:homocitrate synthase NifV